MGLALLVAAVASGAFTTGARAADAAFAVQPISGPVFKQYFVFGSRRGGQSSGSVRVTNIGTQSGTARLYAVDATTGATSGAVYLAARDSKQGVGAWLRLGTSKLTLAPGEARDVSFRIAVPRSAASGEHLGGIVAENAKLHQSRAVTRKKGRFQINIRNLTVLAVQVNVPGPRIAKMVLGGVKSGGSQGGHQTVLVHLRNDGNVMLKPTLALTVTGPGGSTLQKVRVKLDTFLPQTEIDYPVPVRRRALGAGDYRASATLSDGRGHVSNAKASFKVSSKQVKQVFGKDSPLAQQSKRSLSSYIPWIILALIGAYFAYTRLRRRGAGPRSRGTEGPPDASPNGSRGDRSQDSIRELEDEGDTSDEPAGSKTSLRS